MGRQMRYAAGVVTALAVAAAATAGVARASTAPPVGWCGTDVATTDRPDAVAGPQVHVIYAVPSDGVDRFAIFGTGISTDLTAGAAWWQRQDSSRVPRFDLAAFPCFPSLGALDISDVRLPHDSAYYSASSGLFNALNGDLVAAGFANTYKKYLVYYDTPSALPSDLCGQGHEDKANGGKDGYAEVFVSPSLVGGPFESGCGDIATPDDRGGYSAIVAMHELLHTLGALDTESTPGPPHACPGNPAHVCGDNVLDIMEPAGQTYWLDETFLDFGHDDYYMHSGTWWDVQDSTWLRHLNEQTFTLDLTAGEGVASTTSDLPGVDCQGAAHCVSSWDANTVVALTAAPLPGYTRVRWSGVCATAGASPTCTLTLGANTAVTVSYARQLAIASFAAPRQSGSRIQTKLTLSRPPLAGEAHLACRATSGLKLLSHALAGSVASCVWSIPKRLRSRRVSGHITVSTDSGATLARAWSLKVRR
jgi:hypothetical protein